MSRWYFHERWLSSVMEESWDIQVIRNSLLFVHAVIYNKILTGKLFSKISILGFIVGPSSLILDKLEKTTPKGNIGSYLARHGFFEGDFNFSPDSFGSFQDRPDFFLNHMVLFKDINSQTVSHLEKAI